MVLFAISEHQIDFDIHFERFSHFYATNKKFKTRDNTKKRLYEIILLTLICQHCKIADLSVEQFKLLCYGPYSNIN